MGKGWARVGHLKRSFIYYRFHKTMCCVLMYITMQTIFHRIIHELMHTLGFWHEQAREDRDKYIKIIWSNIANDWRGQFEVVKAPLAQLIGEYDLCSIMHYHATAGSKKDRWGRGSTTIVPVNPPRDCKRIGQRKGLSPKDVEKINEFYKCKNTDSGVVTSPNYPKNYGNFVDESTPIEVEDDSRIELTFVDFNIEKGTNCNYDYVSGIPF